MKIKDTKFTRIALIIFTITAITIFGIQAFATPIPGTVVTDTLVVGDTGYTFALADSNYLKGGHMQVADRAALLNTGTDRTVTLERRSVGMLVTVLDDDLGTSGDQTITYRLFTNPSTSSTAITDWRAVLPDSIGGYNGGTNKYLTADASGNYSWGTPSATAGMIMTWPVLAGIALYNGANDWGTSITDNSTNWNTAYGWGDHAGAGYLVSTSSAASMTNFPTFNQDTTGNAGGLTSAYIDWDSLSGGASILNKPIISGSNTGDETTSSIQTKLGFASATTDGYLTSTDWNTFNSNVTYTNLTPTVDTVHGIAAGSTFSSQTMADMFNRLLYPYIAPTITLSAVPSTGVREFGNNVASVTLNATTTKKSNNITLVEFYRGASLIHTQAAPIPGGGLETYVDSTPVTTNGVTFTAKVGDGTGTTTSNGVSYTFVYPFYHGVSVTSSLPNTGIASLTKLIQTIGTKTVTETPSNEYMYFAYPSSYGNLTSIKDINNFETLSSWNTYTVTITGLDSNPISYKVYQSATTVIPSTAQNTFSF